MRSLLLACVVLALLVLAPEVAAQSQPGPRLAFTRFWAKPKDPNNLLKGIRERSKLVTTDPSGGQRQVVVSRRSLIEGASWSADGSFLTFSGGPSNNIFVAEADGSGLRRLTDVNATGSPIFSADGQTILFARANPDIESRGLVSFAFPDSSIWRVGLGGGQAVPVTRPSNTVSDVPGSVSPANGEVAVSHVICDGPSCEYSVRSLSATGGTETVLVNQASDPAFSPDGRELAFVSYRDRNWPTHPHSGRLVLPFAELYVLDLASGVARRLTSTRHVDEAVPSWDPSGQRIAFAADRTRGSSLIEINADGSCRTQLVAVRNKKSSDKFVAVSDPVWQPGSDRGAGRIAC
jgi:Tol biopolymer transport system component